MKELALGHMRWKRVVAKTKDSPNKDEAKPPRYLLRKFFYFFFFDTKSIGAPEPLVRSSSSDLLHPPSPLIRTCWLRHYHLIHSLPHTSILF